MLANCVEVWLAVIVFHVIEADLANLGVCEFTSFLQLHNYVILLKKIVQIKKPVTTDDFQDAQMKDLLSTSAYV